MNRQELIERYKGSYAVIVDALDGANLDARPVPDEWNPREIAHHVADAELTRSVRLRRLLAEDSPHIVGFDQDEYARRLRYDRPVDSSLAAFKAALELNVEILERLGEAEWAREGTHSEDGRYGMESWLERAAEHAYRHAEQIRLCRR